MYHMKVLLNVFKFLPFTSPRTAHGSTVVVKTNNSEALTCVCVCVCVCIYIHFENNISLFLIYKTNIFNYYCIKRFLVWSQSARVKEWIKKSKLYL